MLMDRPPWFPTDEQRLAGATCKGELLIERWAATALDALASVVSAIDLGVLGPVP
jgi:hypothetical protein